MTTGELTDFLIAEITATDSTDFVNDLLSKAKAQILAGGGLIAPLIGGSLNGKSFNRNLRLDAVQVATACRAALDYAAEGEDQKGVSCARMDFSDL